MKTYILSKEKRLSLAKETFFLLKDGLDSIYPHIREHFFVTIHLKYDPDTLLVSMPCCKNPTDQDIADFITSSDIQVGILFKKGDTSTDTFLKAYGLDKESTEMKENRKNRREGSGNKINIKQIMSKIGCPHAE